MDASGINLNLDILKFLKNYFKAKSEHKTNLKDIEIYSTPEDWYNLEKNAPIFDWINAQKIKKYY